MPKEPTYEDLIGWSDSEFAKVKDAHNANVEKRKAEAEADERVKQESL